MEDTITVNKSAPVAPTGNTDATMGSLGDTGSMVGGPPPWMATAIDFDTGAFYNRTVKALSNILKGNKSDKEKQNIALRWFRDCQVMNKCKIDNIPAMGMKDAYFSNQGYKLGETTSKLSNSPYAIVSALGHYLWGSGTNMSVDISVLQLQNLKPQNITGFNERLSSMGQPGKYNLNFLFPYNTAGSNLFMKYILGNITLQLNGTFTRNASGTWGFNGVVTALPDLYNFNASTHREPDNEALTTIGRWMGQHFKGQPYHIDINGKTNVKF